MESKKAKSTIFISDKSKQIVVEKMQQAQPSVASFPANHFRLAIVDMPLSIFPQGIPISGSTDCIQQTITPLDPEVFRQINAESRRKRKDRMASRQLVI
jgi:hypothetical protein